ncbi:bifunctional 3-(3-hydroxy-phenyl)propionate/3-hydroxycinnamic acid hydroxylase MhpA [Streptacidiphilus neutrinimicus]|uniref:bifunctional 3-(3-hydroxy-phenyl)propionate/3-hydroxycinnamic acid hydroxylase MhpA n=1 Tax=Streptacidiphilus neutrinimicus TaxID=105420 RepID=UPI0007C645A7|nr:bifunctional 3-(3-hydroxy-phenyl)propionate/3-hydroxycinnamic acid hydroxylase [Streptacidiphilus neutrinimicus]
MTTVRAAAAAPVVIVGAGPVGVTAAILLARRGVHTVLLERHRDVYPLPRAVAMDDEVRRILQAVGVAEPFATITRPANGLRLLDARHRVFATFRRDGLGRHGYPQTSLFDQPELERLLRQALADHPECELRGGVEVTGVEQAPDQASGAGLVRVTVRPVDGGQSQVVGARAVLGCDGANSIVRQAIGANWQDLRFEERWMVVDARTDLPVRSWEGVDQVCDPARAATFMRIGEDRYRWEFRLLDGEHPGETVDAERVHSLVRPWVHVTDPDSFEILRATGYTFRARIADRWRLGRVFLLGDAAHLTPPFIGQGLCAGLRDAHNLAWKLALVLDGRADERLLESYEAERKPHARQLIRLAVAMGWAMTGGQDRAAALRRRAVAAVCRIPGLTNKISRDMSPALTPGPLVRRGAWEFRSLVGRPCPQPEVTVEGLPTRLDDVLGEGFALLCSAPPGASVRALADSLGARTVRLNGYPLPGETGVLDDGTLTAWLNRSRADAVLLRPDRVVLDVVPRCGGALRDAPTWAALLGTTRVAPHRLAEPGAARRGPNTPSTTPTAAPHSPPSNCSARTEPAAGCATSCTTTACRRSRP